MATTNTAVLRDSSDGELTRTVTTVQFDTSYPSPGGEPLTALQLGLSKVVFAECQVITAATGSVTAVSYDIANAKLKAFTAAAEVADTTNIASVVAQVVAHGYK